MGHNWTYVIFLTKTSDMDIYQQTGVRFDETMNGEIHYRMHFWKKRLVHYPFPPPIQ